MYLQHKEYFINLAARRVKQRDAMESVLMTTALARATISSSEVAILFDNFKSRHDRLTTYYVPVTQDPEMGKEQQEP
jgi:hypothetical protein